MCDAYMCSRGLWSTALACSQRTVFVFAMLLAWQTAPLVPMPLPQAHQAHCFNLQEARFNFLFLVSGASVNLLSGIDWMLQHGVFCLQVLLAIV